MIRSQLARGLLGLLVSPLLAACDPDFPKYNELEGFRVLALRASRPDLRAGDEVVLDALVFVQSGELEKVTYAWSWCPVRKPSSAGGDCAADERTFEAALGLPEGSLNFDLGSGAQARLVVPGTGALYAAACQNAVPTTDLSPRSFVFSCDGGLSISVRADISFAGQTIQVQKEVRLVYEDSVALNHNPALGAVMYRERSAGALDATPWNSEDRPVFSLGKTYEIASAVDEAVGEVFVPAPTALTPSPAARRENLFITWFVTTGEMDAMRTSYIEGSVAIDTLRKNEWELPKAKDESERSANLYLVLRDERGGVDWLERRLELVP